MRNLLIKYVSKHILSTTYLQSSPRHNKHLFTIPTRYCRLLWFYIWKSIFNLSKTKKTSSLTFTPCAVVLQINFVYTIHTCFVHWQFCCICTRFCTCVCVCVCVHYALSSLGNTAMNIITYYACCSLGVFRTRYRSRLRAFRCFILGAMFAFTSGPAHSKSRIFDEVPSMPVDPFCFWSSFRMLFQRLKCLASNVIAHAHRHTHNGGTS